MAEKTKKVKIVRACIVKGEAVDAGKVVELDTKTADYLTAIGRAKALDTKTTDKAETAVVTPDSEKATRK